MESTLLFWDIDGTLLDTCGAGKRSISDALQKAFGIEDDLRYVNLAGSTDAAVGQAILDKHQGINLDRMWTVYASILPQNLTKRKGCILPGVTSFLQWTQSQNHIHNALLTGNMEAGAKAKLAHFGLESYFEFGVYGSQASVRTELAHLAWEQAQERLGSQISKERTWIIGDTPIDLKCAQAIGCKSLIVATGVIPYVDLEKHPASVFVRDLTDLNKLSSLFV